jgi:phenylalanyl-tRNA synthetase beta chain
VRLPCHWLSDLVKVPDAPDRLAAVLALRGFEVASVEHGRQPVIDFEITANRPDCLNVIGLAREASVAYGLPLELPDRTMPPAGPPQPIDVTIDASDLCPRYCAQLFEVRSSGNSPAWMQERLEAAGIRSISAIVDVSNYVMIEMGQPTHAFDYARLSGRTLRIRRAAAEERLRTLDGVERALDSGMLVIADAERAQAIAGVMGGAASEIGRETGVMVLESAYFAPASVRRTSKRLGLKTEASTRFERGGDVEAAPAAIARAAALLQQIGAARPLGPMIDRYPSPQASVSLTLRAARVERVLGVAIADHDVPKILQPLGFTVEVLDRNREGRDADRRAAQLESRSSWQVTVPTFRVDVLREVDLIEELARHDGYIALPATFPALTAPQPPPDPRTVRDRLLRQILTGCGLSEAMTFSFIEASAATPFEAASRIVAVANPLSEKYAVLRPTLLAGLIDAAAYNRRREHHDVRLFEMGTRFTTAGENRAVAGVWCGGGSSSHWSTAPRPADVYDVKGLVEAVGRALGFEPDFEAAPSPYLVAGRSADIFFRRQKIGVLGQVTPAILEARGLAPTDPLFAFELDLALNADQSQELRVESLPRFPSIIRDLSVLVDSTLPAAAVRGTIRSSGPDTLAHVIEFDRYRGKGVPEDRVSLSLRLTFRSPERTLTDAEVDAAMERIVDALAAAHGAVRR